MPLPGVAQSGFASAVNYDTYRPSYIPQAVDRLLTVLEIKGVHGAKILDLAAGTGKFTEILARRPEKYEIIAVEPHDGMRAELDRKQLANVTVQDGSADNLSGIPDHDLKAVIVAQAFHWFSNMEALKEIHRVLQPTGVLGLIWNIEDYNAPKTWDIHPGWQITMRDVMWSLPDGYPRFRDLQWQKVFDEQGRSDPIRLHFADPIFGLPIGEEHFDFETSLTPDDAWNRLQTLSQIANSRGEKLKGIEKTFRDAAEVEKKDDQGRIVVNGKTVIAWASSIPDAPLKSGG